MHTKGRAMNWDRIAGNWAPALIVLTIAMAGTSVPAADAPRTSSANEARRCDKDNGGLKLPPGFCASVFADNLGRARHLIVAPNGDVYVNTWSSVYTDLKNAPGGYIVALRDANRDGRAEVIERFGPVHRDGLAGGGTGIAVHRGALYVEDNGKIVRYPLARNSMLPQGPAEVILSGLPVVRGHIMHPFAIAENGVLFVNSGSQTNSCQEKDRTLESPGISPCPELPLHAGIWRYDAYKIGQVFSPAERYATGTRNDVAMAVREPDGVLYATLHGRDQLADNWPKLYAKEQNNEVPAEILSRIDRNDDFGWPYCYFDARQGKHVLAPEYGGDGGKTQGVCATKKLPNMAFPAHWAPNGMTFYNGSTFPAKYRGGAFVAFHGSWNRTPVQAGFLVAFVPFDGSRPAGGYEEFATGFAGPQLPADPHQAAHRPMGVAVGPDGALYVSDDVKGRVWRITYAGGS
jgi:glucose/arabinose dehydrogenase